MFDFEFVEECNIGEEKKRMMMIVKSVGFYCRCWITTVHKYLVYYNN
jgi:hypothetical protein